MHRLALCMAMIVLVAWPAFAEPYGDKAVVLALRPVKLTYHFTDTPAHPRRGAVVLFVGGAGVLPKQLQGKCNDNFLLRVWKQFPEAGCAVAIPDVPTDHAQGLLGHYRSSGTHAVGDIRAIVYEVQDQVEKAPHILDFMSHPKGN